MSKSLRLSEKHGVNPSMLVCPICFADKGVALLGRLKGDKEAPRAIPDDEPCDECKENMELGFLIVERAGDCITGRRWVIRPEAVNDEELLRRGVAYITPSEAKEMGLYRDD